MGKLAVQQTHINALMATQNGVVSRRQVLDAGFSAAQIERRLRNGTWTLAERGVYQHATAPTTWHAEVQAVTLALDAVASHRSAGYLWGIDGYGRPKVPEVTVARGRHAKRSRITAHESTQMGKTDTVKIDGIATTGIARTVLDIAGVVGLKRINWTLDSVIRQELVTWPELYGVLVRHSRKGRNGCGKLRAVLDVRYGDKVIPDSIWNRQVAQLLNDAGLFPQLEYEVRDGSGAFVARVDLAFPEYKVAVELDSKRWHLNASSFVADPRRRNRLIGQGWTVLNFTWDDYADTPHLLCQTIRKTLRQAKFQS